MLARDPIREVPRASVQQPGLPSGMPCVPPLTLDTTQAMQRFPNPWRMRPMGVGPTYGVPYFVPEIRYTDA